MEHGLAIRKKIRDFEEKLRRWRQLKFGVSDAIFFVPGRRVSTASAAVVPTPTGAGAEASSKHHKNNQPAAPPVSCSRSASSTPRSAGLSRRCLDLPIGLGSSTAPLPRRRLMERPSLSAQTPIEGGQEDDERIVADGKTMRQAVDWLAKDANKLKLPGEPRWQRVTAEQFDTVQQIGFGHYGEVKTMSFKGQLYAVKTIFQNPRSEDIRLLLREAFMSMQQHDCKHIVSGYGYFMQETRLSLVMEKCATCLGRLQRRRGFRTMNQKLLKRIVADVVIGLKYLREHYEIMHRDVKPSNILLTWDGLAKICDFGIAGKIVGSRVYSQAIGCPPYMAPERFMKEPEDKRLRELYAANYDTRADIWSLGITQVELVTGKHPYMWGDGSNEFAMIAKVIEQPPPVLRKDDNPDYEDDLVDFSRRVLAKNPMERPKYADVVKTNYFLSGSVIEHECVAECVVKYYQLAEDDVVVEEQPPVQFPPDDNPAWTHPPQEEIPEARIITNPNAEGVGGEGDGGVAKEEEKAEEEEKPGTSKTEGAGDAYQGTTRNPKFQKF